MRKIIIGLFCPINVDLTQYVNRLQGLGEIRLIMARQENLGPIDLLIYPDGMGILPDTPGLYHGKRIFTPTNPINPFFFLFWNERPFQTIIEERNIPIIGFGEAAAMLHSELGGKLVIDAMGTVDMLNEEGDVIDYFESNKVYGVTSHIGFTRAIRLAIDDIITGDSIEDLEKDDDDNDDVPIVPKLPPSPPPRLKGKE